VHLLESLGLDALIVSGGTNRRYLSGWSAEDHAPDRPHGVMLISNSARTLYASPTNLPWAQAEVLATVATRPLTGAWTKVLSDDIRRQGFTRVGFEDAVTPVGSYWALAEQLAGAAELFPVGSAIDTLRQVKSGQELDLIRQAIRMTDVAFERGAATLRAGMTERELASAIQDALRDLGSEGEAFPTIVASGPNAARPHHTPGDRTIADGDPVIIDMGARVQGYCGDLTRTIWVGQPGERLGTMYRLVAEAQRAALAAVKGGVEAAAVDRAARDVFTSAGVGENFVHGVGHAIGLRIHEAPFMGQTSEDVLRPGNVVTIEPGLYFTDWGGVRIEDVVVVEADGCTNLTGAPKLLGA
jgi:Xaa-Pro aminopeptidase